LIAALSIEKGMWASIAGLLYQYQKSMNDTLCYGNSWRYVIYDLSPSKCLTDRTDATVQINSRTNYPQFPQNRGINKKTPPPGIRSRGFYLEEEPHFFEMR
jgi:hypothetical protein